MQLCSKTEHTYQSTVLYLREAVREMIRDEVSSIESLEYKALSHINEQVIDKMRYIRLFFSIQKNKYKRYIIKEIRKRMR